MLHRLWSMGSSALVGLILGGCFVDQATAVDRVCVAGQSTCECLAGGGCDGTLECDDANVCRDSRCTPGREGCECNSGTCDTGLSCDAESNSCLKLTSEPEPLPDSTLELDSDFLTDTFAESGVMEPDVGEAEVGECGCGWDPQSSFYLCGVDLVPESATDEFQRQCPLWIRAVAQMEGPSVLDGQPCAPMPGETPLPPLSYQGCCLGNVTFFCDEEDDASAGRIVVIDCEDDEGQFNCE